MRILILGGSGFLGEQICRVLSDFDINSPSRNRLLRLVQDDMLSCEYSETNVIVNCLSATNQTLAKEEIFFANFELPKKIFEQFSQKKIFWINFDTYFQFYFNSFGKHKNFYSECKFMFTNFLKSQIPEATIYTRNYVLPHLLGPSERKGRFVRDVFENISQGKQIKISSGNQIIPVTDIENFAIYLRSQFVQLSHAEGPAKKFEEFNVPPSKVLQVKELARLISNLYERDSLLLVGEQQYFENEFFSLDWPEECQPPEYPILELEITLRKYLLDFPAS
jgi:nucleoside-diphosphate-sugar epimerase